MIFKFKYGAAFVLILLLAGFFRLKDPDSRPMHTDESVNAIKFGRLLEEGFYRYDPFEYHGPALNYLTLIPAWLSGKNRLTEVTEATLRLVPALCGLGLILILPLYFPGMNRKTLFFTALFTAISPVMVFYSRYYIMEIMLVFFTFGMMGAIYRFTRTARTGWLVVGGVFLGLMHATKETFIISLAVMIFSLSILVVIDRNFLRQSKLLISSVNRYQTALFIVIALGTSILFFSSFFSNWQGTTDSITTYLTYFERAGQQDKHEHPWYYYLNILGWYPGPRRVVWTELFILILAVTGISGLMLNSKNRNSLPVFLALFSILLFLIYSIIPYKTPWNILTAYTGLIFMAGYGLDFLLEKLKKAWTGILLVFLIGFGFTHLIVQSYLVNFAYEAHPSNPYVYGHTSKDIYRFVNRIERVAEVHPAGKDMYIEVISPGGDYWPLPWYLRKYKNTGWWTAVDMNVPAASLIIASPEVEEKLMEKLYEKPPPGKRDLYMPLIREYTELRPGIEIRGYLRKDIWDRYFPLIKEE